LNPGDSIGSPLSEASVGEVRAYPLATAVEQRHPWAVATSAWGTAFGTLRIEGSSGAAVPRHSEDHSPSSINVGRVTQKPVEPLIHRINDITRRRGNRHGHVVDGIITGWATHRGQTGAELVPAVLEPDPDEQGCAPVVYQGHLPQWLVTGVALRAADKRHEGAGAQTFIVARHRQ
jgi:hypothetical protein